jgi:hypothetical protein
VPAEADGPFVSRQEKLEMKSEACAAHDELANTPSIGETLEAPISLNPEQLESIVAGLSLSSIKGTICGGIWAALSKVGTFGAPSQLGNIGAQSQF